jgi:hypothetical protein
VAGAVAVEAQQRLDEGAVQLGDGVVQAVCGEDVEVLVERKSS